MWPAEYRAQKAVPKSLESYRPQRGEAPLALRCTKSNCGACKAFHGARREAFEASAALQGATVKPWNCDDERGEHFYLATEAKVKDLPSYILLLPKPSRAVRVVRPW